MKWPTLTSWIYAWGSLGLFGLISFLFPQNATLALLVFPVLVAGLLLGPWPGLFNGLAASVIILVGNPYLPGSNITLFWLIVIASTCAIGMIAGHALAQVDYWERALVLEQRQSIVRLQERQGELNRALKAYDEACMRLERSNNELAVARQLAEEARVLKEQFAANVSHELRTPLNIIVGFAEEMYLFPESYPGVSWTPALQGDIQEIYRSSRHLQSLVDDVLDLARIDAARLPMYRELQDIRCLIDGAVETVAPLLRQRGLSYELDYSSDLPPLFVDRTRIRQIMINLLNNAARFTDEGGIRVQVALEDRSVVISVHDTGIGIPPEQLDTIFQEFTQVETGLSRRGGTGLGLALSRQFVALHGGRMWAESKLGKGSTFHFALPLPGTTPHTAPVQRTRDHSQADLTSAPIILVDPDPSMGDMIGRYLGDRIILGARDTQQALELTQREHPLAVVINLPPDTSAADWTAPLGGAMEEFGVPVFRCSIPSPSWLQYSVGFDGCLTKPVSREALRDVLEEYSQPVSVLVVDDDPGFVRLMTRILHDMKAVRVVRSAYDGLHALRLAQEERPDLVLLDLLMPEMDGFQILKVLRAAPKQNGTHIIAVTATTYGEEALTRRASHFTLTQETGLDTAALLHLLNSALDWVRPDYTAGETNSSRA
jgi:signal transduction histidine kinase/CheY-like chemotaxis protein